MGTVQRGRPDTAGGDRPVGEGAAGRIEIRERVLVKVAREASASAIGVARADVAVDVADFRDGIAVRVASPLPIPDLGDTSAVRATVPVLEQAARLQDDLAENLARLLGREIVKVNLTITGAIIPERRRVR